MKAKMKNIRLALSDSRIMGCVNLVLVLGAVLGPAAISAVCLLSILALCAAYAYLLLAE